MTGQETPPATPRWRGSGGDCTAAIIQQDGDLSSVFAVFQHGNPAPGLVVDRIVYLLNIAEDALVAAVAAADRLRDVQAERDALRAKLEAWLNGPPAEMSYNGRLVPINSTGMREVIDEAVALAAQNRALWDFVRAYDAAPRRLSPGAATQVGAALARLDAARAALGDTP
jgi:hypothetical protein